MTKIKRKNISGEDFQCPALGGRLILAGQVVEVDADAPITFPDTLWAVVDEDKKG